MLITEGKKMKNDSKWLQIVWTMKKHRAGESLAAGASVNIHYSEKAFENWEKQRETKRDEREMWITLLIQGQMYVR